MNDIIHKIEESAEFLRNFYPNHIDASVILGSGLGDLADEISETKKIDYKDIPNFPVSTVFGHAGRLIAGKAGSRNILIMQGRFHYYEGYGMDDITFPIRVMSRMGIKKLLLTNASGGINLKFKPGDLMIIKDHINLSMKNPLIGKNLDDFGPRFPDMSRCYSISLNKKIADICSSGGVDYVSGVYAYLTGPSFETPSEIKMLRKLGADAVGMSTVPEAIVAKHCGMEICGISCITNMAAGILNKPLSHEEVIETSNMVKDKFKYVLRKLLYEV